MTAARGTALILAAGQPILMGDPGEALTDFGSGFLFGVPQPLILMFVVFAVAGVVLNLTKFGRIVKAIGFNAEAVRLSGIAAPRYVMAVYVLSGALAALAGVISASRTGVGSGSIGVGAELDVIAAVVIGVASLMGGRGGVVNTLLGALVMGVIGNIILRPARAEGPQRCRSAGSERDRHRRHRTGAKGRGSQDRCGSLAMKTAADRRRSVANGVTTSTVLRCAVYTRKSTEYGLEQEFDSLDNHR